MSEKRFRIVHLNLKRLDMCDIQDTAQEIPTFYNDLGHINSVEPVCELLNSLNDENRELRQQLQEKQEDEKLYAQEILELNKTKKEMLNFKQLGGDY